MVRNDLREGEADAGCNVRVSMCATPGGSSGSETALQSQTLPVASRRYGKAGQQAPTAGRSVGRSALSVGSETLCVCCCAGAWAHDDTSGIQAAQHSAECTESAPLAMPPVAPRPTRRRPVKKFVPVFGLIGESSGVAQVSQSGCFWLATRTTLHYGFNLVYRW